MNKPLQHGDKANIDTSLPTVKVDREDTEAVSVFQGQVELAAAKAVTKALKQFPGFLNMKRGMVVARKQFTKELGKRGLQIEDADFDTFITAVYNRGLEQAKENAKVN